MTVTGSKSRMKNSILLRFGLRLGGSTVKNWTDVDRNDYRGLLFFLAFLSYSNLWQNSML